LSYDLIVRQFRSRIDRNFRNFVIHSGQKEISPNSEQNDRTTNDHKQVNEAIIKAFQKPLFSIGESTEYPDKLKEIQGKHLQKIANATKE